MKILIAVPTLDSWKTLTNLIYSLKIQTNPNWKLLIIDGKSSKEHVNYLKKISKEDKRINFIKQNKKNKGIFGAMNQAFDLADKEDFLLFWGSDESCYSDKTIDFLIKKLNHLMLYNNDRKLFIFDSEWINNSGLKNKRLSFSKISHEHIINMDKYRFDLFWGYTQAHQATLFSPSMRSITKRYSTKFELAADLDYFLRISKNKTFQVIKIPKKIVLIGEGGISSRKNIKRFFEVMQAYFYSFGFAFIIPFISRYIRRIFGKYLNK